MEAQVQPLAFLEWLQNTHPDLYTCYWEWINISDKSISVDDNALKQEDLKKLLLAIEEYYGMVA